MSFTKFKICPACEERNPPARFECLKCEADLTGIRVVDENSLQENTSKSGSGEMNRDAAYNKLVKQCDCGAANPPQARKCTACGEDISDIRPAPLQTTENVIKVLLRAVDSDYSFMIDKKVTIIGREADMSDFLSGKSYVSRQHAKLTITSDGVYIESMNATNHTFVNNLPIPNGVPALLKHGDEIGIGGKVVNGNRQNEAAYCVFEIAT